MQIVTEFGRKVAHGPQKKRLDFDGNPDHVALGLRLGRTSDNSCHCNILWDYGNTATSLILVRG